MFKQKKELLISVSFNSHETMNPKNCHLRNMRNLIFQFGTCQHIAAEQNRLILQWVKKKKKKKFFRAQHYVEFTIPQNKKCLETKVKVFSSFCRQMVLKRLTCPMQRAAFLQKPTFERELSPFISKCVKSLFSVRVYPTSFVLSLYIFAILLYIGYNFWLHYCRIPTTCFIYYLRMFYRDSLL